MKVGDFRMYINERGYPSIEISHPYEKFGIYFSFELSRSKIEELQSAINKLSQNNSECVDIIRDDLTIELDMMISESANMYLDEGYHIDEEILDHTMPIGLFCRIASAWIRYVTAWLESEK